MKLLKWASRRESIEKTAPPLVNWSAQLSTNEELDIVTAALFSPSAPPPPPGLNAKFLLKRVEEMDMVPEEHMIPPPRNAWQR